MITGLRLTFTGDELLRALDERTGAHRERAERCRRYGENEGEDEGHQLAMMPEQVRENEAQWHQWRGRIGVDP